MTSKQKICRPTRGGKSRLFSEKFCGSFVERSDSPVNAASQIARGSGDAGNDS